MCTKTLIIFPYPGYQTNSKREELFWKLVKKCQTIDDKPVVVLDANTSRSGWANNFENDKRSNDLDIQTVWSVDTCQRWYAAWGYIIETYKECSRIVQLPGDIDDITDEVKFFASLDILIRASNHNILIGDFDTGQKFGSKELIDTYGTYSLLANWFPTISKALQALPLSKPRSEFINIELSTLKELLEYKSFAYEQTLNMLIRSWDFDFSKWKYIIGVQDLGRLRDDSSLREYRSSLDQIERTERLLKLVWRELNEPKPSNDLSFYQQQYKKFSDEYDRLDKISTNSRENARTTIRALLGT